MRDNSGKEIVRALEKRIERMDGVPAWVRRGFRSDLGSLRKRGIVTVPGMRSAIADETLPPRVRSSACAMIRLLGDKGAARLLLSTLDKAASPELTWEIAKTLVAIGGKGVRTGLLRRLRHTFERDRAIVYALGYLGESRAVPALVARLSDQSNSPGLRGEAAEALGLIGDRRALTALISATRDRAVEVRFWSTFALGKIVDKRAMAALQAVRNTDKARLRGWGSLKREAERAIASLRQLICCQKRR
jgi:HEAT repeat protein